MSLRLHLYSLFTCDCDQGAEIIKNIKKQSLTWKQNVEVASVKMSTFRPLNAKKKKNIMRKLFYRLILKTDVWGKIINDVPALIQHPSANKLFIHHYFDLFRQGQSVQSFEVSHIKPA